MAKQVGKACIQRCSYSVLCRLIGVRQNTGLQTMNAVVVRDFFIGRATAPQLAEDLRDAFEHVSSQGRRLHMQDLDKDFELRSEHLVRLCDAVLAGLVPPEGLEAIGFGLIASDFFTWDGDSPDGSRVAETLYDWSSPEINYALTKDTARKFKERLLTGEDTFTQADAGSTSA